VLIKGSPPEDMARIIICMILSLAVSGCGLSTGTTVRTGEAARGRILSNGVRLPISATNLYYAFQPQFANYIDTWISFTATPADCTSVAQALARSKTNAPVFVPGTRSREDAVTRGPAYHHPEFASPCWNLSSVTNGTMFETKGLFVLIDNDNHRIYVSLRSP
jgi:hypothetical protein